MDDTVKHLARLLRSGAITPQTYVEGLSALADTPLTLAPRQRCEPPTPVPSQRPTPAHAPASHPSPARPADGWDGRLHRGDPFRNAGRAAHPGPTAAKAYPAPAGVPPDSLGHRLIPARMADGCASRAPPRCRPQGLLRGGATTDSGQALGRDQGSEWN